MKLLCTLASLCEGSPLQPLRLDFFGSNFPLILAHNYHLSFLVDTVTEQVERCADPMIALRSPTLPPHRHCYPSHLPLIHRQGKLHAAPRHSASPRAAAGMFSLHLAKYFFRSLTVFFLYIFRNLSWSSHPLEEVTLKLKEGAVKFRRGEGEGKVWMTRAAEEVVGVARAVMIIQWRRSTGQCVIQYRGWCHSCFRVGHGK